ncbi:MAG TPA: hypothetical protein VMS22_02620 [Candidatus Eisenbacteria bacterium]|nr:hypothetical protein [Candidatus Eisenbacteria bacterium]
MIGVVAAIAASVGDLLLLLASNAARPDLAWLPRPSGTALLAGTYLGVVAIPVYGIGYRGVAARFSSVPAAPNLAHVVFFALVALGRRRP